jgi:hypothetical protein
MFRTVLCSTLALVAGSAVIAMADAKDDVTAAATKLSDASSYSWKSATEGGGGGGGRGGGGPVEGKTEKGGFTTLTTSFNDMTRVTVIKGDKWAATNRDGEWQSNTEIAAAAAAAAADANAGGGGRRGRGGQNYANYKLPAALASDLVAKTASLSSADGAISGDLTEEGAKALAAPPGGARGGRRGGGNAGGGGGGGGMQNAKASRREEEA